MLHLIKRSQGSTIVFEVRPRERRFTRMFLMCLGVCIIVHISLYFLISIDKDIPASHPPKTFVRISDIAPSMIPTSSLDDPLPYPPFLQP